MMLTAMQHLDSTAYAYASPSSASASPWQQQQQLLPEDGGYLLHDYDLIGSAPAPAPPSAPAAVQHAPASHHQHKAAHRVAKRRPRSSRRLPVTYVSADPAEFRRMVQQVTGADDLLLPQQEELLYRPAAAGRAAASMAGHAGAGALLLPTLDTSAFLLGRARPAAARTTEAPPPPLPSCDGSLALDNTSGSSNRGFPTLESWNLKF